MNDMLQQLADILAQRKQTGNADDSYVASLHQKGLNKILHFFEGDRWELYDLASDISESHDVSVERPEVTGELRAALARWWSETGAFTPTEPNPAFEPTGWPDGSTREPEAHDPRRPRVGRDRSTGETACRTGASSVDDSSVAFAPRTGHFTASRTRPPGPSTEPRSSSTLTSPGSEAARRR